MLALNGKYPGKMTPSFQHVNGGHGTASPSPFSARQTQAMPHHQQVQGSPAPSRAQPTGSASQPREFVKPRAADAAPDAMDLSRVHKREGPIGRGLQSYDQVRQDKKAKNEENRQREDENEVLLTVGTASVTRGDRHFEERPAPAASLFHLAGSPGPRKASAGGAVVRWTAQFHVRTGPCH